MTATDTRSWLSPDHSRRSTGTPRRMRICAQPDRTHTRRAYASDWIRVHRLVSRPTRDQVAAGSAETVALYLAEYAPGRRLRRTGGGLFVHQSHEMSCLGPLPYHRVHTALRRPKRCLLGLERPTSLGVSEWSAPPMAHRLSVSPSANASGPHRPHHASNLARRDFLRLVSKPKPFSALSVPLLRVLSCCCV